MASGRQQWSPFDVVTHTALNGIADRGVMNFASAAARTSAIPSPENGMLTTLDTNPGVIYQYGSGSWQAKTFSTPAITAQGQSSVQVLTGGTLTGGAADTWSGWISGGTSPGSSSYLTAAALASGGGMAGFGSATAVLFEFSLDAGTTVWKRVMLSALAGNAPGGSVNVTPRSAPSSSTVHYRFKILDAQGGNVTVTPVVTWTQTVPPVVLTAAESLWEVATAGSAFGTWTTLGTVGAAHRLCAVAGQMNTDGGLATGAGSTVIGRWRTAGLPLVYGQNTAVPSGALKASGYGARIWVLTEPV